MGSGEQCWWLVAVSCGMVWWFALCFFDYRFRDEGRPDTMEYWILRLSGACGLGGHAGGGFHRERVGRVFVLLYEVDDDDERHGIA